MVTGMLLHAHLLSFKCYCCFQDTLLKTTIYLYTISHYQIEKFLSTAMLCAALHYVYWVLRWSFIMNLLACFV